MFFDSGILRICMRLQIDTTCVPDSFGREEEERLLALCASGNIDPQVWRSHGPVFFVAGLAAMLGSVDGFDRASYLQLAEKLYPGMSTPEGFGSRLTHTPLRPARFIPRLERLNRA